MRFRLSLVTSMSVLVSLVGGLVPHVSAAESRSCPDPRSCALYRLLPYRWATRQGKIVIPFFVNATQPWVSGDRAVGAILRATEPWMKANPSVKLVFKGVTDKLPGTEDGANVIGWGPLEPGTIAAADRFHPNESKRIREADITFNVLLPWAWTPCAQRHGSCTRVPSDLISYLDIQAIATHELGHWLGLDDLTDEAARNLTMYGNVGPGERQSSTLGLGDIRGLRAAYPCKGCDQERVYVP